MHQIRQDGQCYMAIATPLEGGRERERELLFNVIFWVFERKALEGISIRVGCLEHKTRKEKGEVQVFPLESCRLVVMKQSRRKEFIQCLKLMDRR